MTADDICNFPELTREENELIQRAREQGFAKYWAVYPDAEAQALNTLNGARLFLRGIDAESHNYGKER